MANEKRVNNSGIVLQCSSVQVNHGLNSVIPIPLITGFGW